MAWSAITFVRQENDGRHAGQHRTISTKADIDIMLNANKTADSHPDYRVLTQGIEIVRCSTVKNEISNKQYVSVSLGDSEFVRK